MYHFNQGIWIYEFLGACGSRRPTLYVIKFLQKIVERVSRFDVRDLKALSFPLFWKKWEPQCTGSLLLRLRFICPSPQGWLSGVCSRSDHVHTLGSSSWEFLLLTYPAKWDKSSISYCWLDFQAGEFVRLIQDITTDGYRNRWVEQIISFNDTSWISWTSSGHFVSLLHENESENASRLLFPCKEPRALMPALPQHCVSDPCSLLGSQACCRLFTEVLGRNVCLRHLECELQEK